MVRFKYICSLCILFKSDNNRCCLCKDKYLFLVIQKKDKKKTFVFLRKPFNWVVSEHIS